MKKNRRSNGFTLMELLIVLVILGLLAALVGPTLYQRIKPAKQSVANAQITNFSTALDTFFVDVGRYPTSQEGLNALRQKPQTANKWIGPYVKKDIPLDPWGHAYLYQAPGRNNGFEIISLGADGVEGGEGENKDLNSWEN